MNVEPLNLDLSGLLTTALVSAITVLVALWGQSKLAAKNVEVLDVDVKRLDLEHSKRLAEFKAEHAKEVGELKAAWASAGSETRQTLNRLAEGMAELRRSVDTISVALIGIDGKNGIRGEVKMLHEDHRHLVTRVAELDFAQRLLAKGGTSQEE